MTKQLRCSGVFEAVRIRKSGYPFRHRLDLFVHWYKCLLLDPNEPRRFALAVQIAARLYARVLPSTLGCCSAGGLLTMADGCPTTYSLYAPGEGEWRNDKMEGKGKITHKESGEVWEGTFADGKKVVA